MYSGKLVFAQTMEHLFQHTSAMRSTLQWQPAYQKFYLSGLMPLHGVRSAMGFLLQVGRVVKRFHFGAITNDAASSLEKAAVGKLKFRLNYDQWLGKPTCVNSKQASVATLQCFVAMRLGSFGGYCICMSNGHLYDFMRGDARYKRTLSKRSQRLYFGGVTKTQDDFTLGKTSWWGPSGGAGHCQLEV